MEDLQTGVMDASPASEPVIDQSVPQETGEQQAPPAPNVEELTRQIEGLKQGIMAERERRQAFQEQYQTVMARLQQAEATKEPEFADDDYLTAGHVKQLLNKQIGTVADQIRQSKVAMSEEYARGQFKDYDDVVDMVIRENDPIIMQKIMDDPNPAMRAYKYGLGLRAMDPSYLGKIKEEAVKEALAQMQQKTQSKTLSSVPGQVQQPFSEMSDEQVLAHLDKMRGY